MSLGLTWSDLDVQRVLGEGQAGVASLALLKKPYAGFQAGQRVAVKQYKSWVLAESGQLERIIRELEVGRTFPHPSVVKTITIVTDPAGRPALIMEFVEGDTLDAALTSARKTGAPPSFSDCMSIVHALATALKHLHEHGVVHRDIKPKNIVLSSHGPVLMDLGVVKSQSFAEQTATIEFLGTIRYAAPEVLFGADAAQSADIYSLGAVAAELVSLQRFRGDTDHWARLVVAAREGNTATSLGAIARLHGYNAAWFADAVFKATLARKTRRYSAAALLTMLDTRAWEPTRFYIRRFLHLAEISPLTPEQLVQLRQASRGWKRQLGAEGLRAFEALVSRELRLPFDRTLDRESDEIQWFVGIGVVEQEDDEELRCYIGQDAFDALRLGFLC